MTSGPRALALIVFTLLAGAPLTLPAAADAGYPIDEWLAEVAFEEVVLSPDGGRLAFVSRQDDFERDVEVLSLWWLDLSAPGSQEPVRLVAGPGGYAELSWSPDGGAADVARSGNGRGCAAAQRPRPAVRRRPAAGDRSCPLRVRHHHVRLAARRLGSDPRGRRAADRGGSRRRRRTPPCLRRRPPPSPDPPSNLYRLARADFAIGSAAPVFVATAEPNVWALRVSPDGSRAALTGGKFSDPARRCEVSVVPLTPQPATASPVRTDNWAFEDRAFWAGRDLLFSGAGEERDDRYTFTEARLHRIDPATGATTPITPGLEGHILETVPVADGSVLAVALYSTRTRIYRIAPATGRVETLADLRGDISRLTASRDGDKIAFVRHDRRFPEVWLADGPDGIASPRVLTRFNAALERHPAPELETVSWSNGQGDTIEGVLIWPPGRKGAKGLPLVVNLHGGPMGAVRTETVSSGGSFTAYTGLLASRGFLVLAPNYRGGSGRGDAFTQAIEDRHCSRPSADAITGAESLLSQGWADRARLAVSGYSGGGVLTN